MGVGMIGPYLRMLRQARGLGQQALAKRVRMDVGALIDYERGNSTPNAERLQALYAALDAPQLSGLVLEILSGTIQTPDDVAAWLKEIVS